MRTEHLVAVDHSAGGSCRLETGGASPKVRFFERNESEVTDLEFSGIVPPFEDLGEKLEINSGEVGDPPECLLTFGGSAGPADRAFDSGEGRIGGKPDSEAARAKESDLVRYELGRVGAVLDGAEVGNQDRVVLWQIWDQYRLLVGIQLVGELDRWVDFFD